METKKGQVLGRQSILFPLLRIDLSAVKMLPAFLVCLFPVLYQVHSSINDEGFNFNLVSINELGPCAAGTTASDEVLKETFGLSRET